MVDLNIVYRDKPEVLKWANSIAGDITKRYTVPLSTIGMIMQIEFVDCGFELSPDNDTSGVSMKVVITKVLDNYEHIIMKSRLYNMLSLLDLECSQNLDYVFEVIDNYVHSAVCDILSAIIERYK